MGDKAVTLAGREYSFPDAPVVVVCVDGSEPDYHERAIAAGRMPYLQDLVAGAGTVTTAESAMPSFTNPNNLSIATGASPAVHGICGNYFYDADREEEVMMNSPELLRSSTLFAEFSRAGARVAVVTAKDKLRCLLGAGLGEGGICFSAEYAASATLAENGIDQVLDLVGMPQPEVYSAELSEFVLAAGVRVLERDRPDLVYLSLTDYIQHKHAPGSPVANDFYAMIDGYLRRLDALGAVLVVTGDHGMNAKADTEGRPNVVYAQNLLDNALGAGRSRVVLPITDPYTVHHGALGSFATIHLDDPADQATAQTLLRQTPGVSEVLTRAEAATTFELPPDRIGELVVLAEIDTVLGTAAERHDLTQLREPLRSHGGRTEQRVPMIVNRALADLPAGHRLRNYDAYWLALNQVVDGRAAPTTPPSTAQHG